MANSKSFGIFKEVLAITFATPASAGVLQSLDDRIRLGEILQRVVLNYNVVVDSLWTEFTNLLPFDWPLDQKLSIFSLFITCQIMGGIILARFRSDALDSRNTWGSISFLFLGFFTWVFAIPGNVVEAGFLFDLLSFLIILALLVVFLISVIPKIKNVAGLGIVLLLSLVALALIYSYRAGPIKLINGVMGQPTNGSLVDWRAAMEQFAFAAYIVALSLVCVRKNLRGPAYVGLWSIGVISINWLAIHVFLPVVGWLESIGA